MITIDQIHAFVRALPDGALLKTLWRPSHFRAELHGETILCLKDGNEVGKITRNDLEKYLHYANFLKGDDRFVIDEYPPNLFTRSYFVSILKQTLLAPPEPGFALPEECSDPKQYFEGATTTITVNRYERDDGARAECIAIHGAVCAVCRTPMTALYGPDAEGLIHVHHLRSLSSIGKEYRVDPKLDLLPVCPNCHAFIHWKRRTDDARTPNEVRHIIDQHRQYSGR